ncbi:MAG TPA: two-component regulator propeller domain-containing protein [Edaphocola sp.]|nr:two-component regulator propeller domain-containing protein [Edaphocola sp.]
MKYSFLFVFIFLFSFQGFAQSKDVAVGGWNAYLPYRTVIDFDTKDNNTFYCISNASFFTYDAQENYIVAYSKANGMHDVDMSFVTIDDKTDKVALVYKNGNIDLFNNGIFQNIPDIKVTENSGDKTIYAVKAYQGKLYICSGLGLVIVDLERNEIKETVPFYQGSNQGTAKAVTILNNNIIVATNIGVFSTPVSNPLIVNYATWDKISSQEMNFVDNNNNQLFAAFGKDVYHFENNNFSVIKTVLNPIKNINTDQQGNLWVMTIEMDNYPPYLVKINPTGSVVDSIPKTLFYKFLDQGSGMYWACDGYFGLRKGDSTTPTMNWEVIAASGPFSANVEKVWSKNKEIWLAHGLKEYNNWMPFLNQDGFSFFNYYDWFNWKWDILGLVAPDKQYTVTDAIDILRDESNKTTYVALLNSGLLELDKDNKLHLYKQGFLGMNNAGDVDGYRVTALAMDNVNNLWMTQSETGYPLRVKKASGVWDSFKINGVSHLANIVIDDYGQKWMAAGINRDGGLVVYNDNNTLENKNDDKYVILRKGENIGNLPSNAVNTIAKDKDGAIWVGTESGVGIFYCGDIQNNNPCNAVLKALISKDYNFANYMFEGVPVKSIAIDGGNRKWIGTNVGVFLLSEDGETILEQFNESNSPLLSNNIKSISIDPIIGTVYFATDKGLCSVGGKAVEASPEVIKPLFVYPNPVPSGYNGYVSIKGMTAGANVKITDINGQLVYQASANGGMLSWNGKDYKGRKVQSGVYLVFVVGKDGTNKANGKFIIHE